MKLKQYLESLNQNYLKVHSQKEELFWIMYMGLGSKAEKFSEAEIKFKDFISDETRLKEIENLLHTNSQLPPESDESIALKGWREFFKSHVIPHEKGRKIQEELIRRESELLNKRKGAHFFFKDEQGKNVEASTLRLSTNLATHPNEAVRKSSHAAFLELEEWVLDNGFLEIVKKRNLLAKELGYRDYFEYSVFKNEKMSTEDLFKILDDFEARTAKSYQKALAHMQNKLGKGSTLAHNLKFNISGEVEKKLDPFLPFEKALENWALSFSRMNISFRGADLTLDLFDRKGKHENGFMHGPLPAFFAGETWQPAKINFTSNANPDQVGSGYSGLNTLFHEGGHAAHFSNITMNAPCFSQEFAPTAMSYAETQSMFCDSILKDGDWLKTYAKDTKGQPIPDEIIQEYTLSKQPFFGYGERSILVVPYFERALYALDNKDLTKENVIRLARQMEQKILFLEASPRPLMAIPHLISDESACAYHGYLLANMAVYQTRHYFLEKDGFLADNENIGPQLAQHYWAPGNSKTHSETLLSLTGEHFSAKYLAERCNKSPEELWKSVKDQIDSVKKKSHPRNPSENINLDAKIKVVHGQEKISSNENSYSQLFQNFENWVFKHYRNPLGN